MLTISLSLSATSKDTLNAVTMVSYEQGVGHRLLAGTRPAPAKRWLVVAAATFVLTITVVAAATFVLTITVVVAVAFVLTITVVVAVAFVLALTVVVAVATAAMMRVVSLLQLLYFFLRGLTVHENLAAERDVHAGQGMVEVNPHALIAHAHHATYETVAILVEQRYDGVFVHVGGVEHAVFHEMILGNVEDHVVAPVAIGMVLADGELEVFAVAILRDVFLESVESHAKARVELQRVALRGFLNQLQTVAVVYEKLVVCFYVPVHKLLCSCE